MRRGIPAEPTQVHWEEGGIDSGEGEPEVRLSHCLGVAPANDDSKPEVQSSEDREHGSHGEDVVEVRDDVVGVMQRDVNTGVGDHRPSAKEEGGFERRMSGKVCHRQPRMPESMHDHHEPELAACGIGDDALGVVLMKSE
jgi:hypothetical protein